MTPRLDPSWRRFVSETRATFFLWLLVAAGFSLWRLAFLIRFWPATGAEATAGGVFAVMVHGLRFDARLASLITAPAILFALLGAAADLGAASPRLRNFIAYAYATITPFFGCVALGYYAEFGRPFGLNVFDLIYDDTTAILVTMVSDYGLVSNGIVAGVISLAALLPWRRLRHRELIPAPWTRLAALSGWPRSLAAVILLALVVGAARGSFGGRPAMRKWSSVTPDRVLNDAVMPPYTWLIYAVRDRNRLARGPRLEALLPDGDVRGAAQRFFATPEHHPTLDAYFARTAAGTTGEPPTHVFLIVMESYDTWPLAERFLPWGVSTQLRDLASRGLYVERFLPGGETTMATLATLLLGLPDVGLFTARQPTTRETFPTSLPAAMGRLGYRTRLFYGGMLSWQRLGDFARAQGFDEAYGRSHIAPQPGSAWGLDDAQLFDFVDATVSDDPPSFNLVLTLSNHPPYDLPLGELGFRPPPDFTPRPRLDRVHLGHLWYADQQIGRLVSQIESRQPGALFLLTGDHYGRRHPDPSPPPRERAAVPFVLYGPEVLSAVALPADTVGSHLDVTPTLVELCAPAGFPYAAVGRNLLAPHPAPIGYGKERLILPNALIELDGEPQAHPRPGRSAPTAVDLERLARRHADLQAIAWWRILQGPALPD